jgi:hypothetical protein
MLVLHSQPRVYFLLEQQGTIRQAAGAPTRQEQRCAGVFGNQGRPLQPLVQTQLLPAPELSRTPGALEVKLNRSRFRERGLERRPLRKLDQLGAGKTELKADAINDRTTIRPVAKALAIERLKSCLEISLGRS